MNIKLKPVVYTTSYFKRGSQNTAQQLFLLKAMQVTQDPQKLRAMIGVKTVADVYRTLDKISMRKEFHEALSRQGISFDFIVKGIKDIAISGEKDGDRLKAYQTILKSVGLEKYDSDGGVGQGTWEETLLKKIEDNKSSTKELAAGDGPVEYVVTQPVMPESVRKQKEEDDEALSSIYETK